ncbi:MAG: gliding motility-associated C-terminal domain-containing protein [Bacteroidetes bacterium]|nr:gliding motility-associated C-terminal domain-containing protein [Bacteroidota bacterium]
MVAKLQVVPALAVGIPQKYRHQLSGQYIDGIKIESDEQITAYAHCWGSTSSGATMLMPACTWGYEYKMLGYHQNWGGWSFSSYFVVANQNNTRIAFTNTVNTQGVPQLDTVTLNAGDWYQVLAASSTEDLSGSLVKSVPNNNGKCYPFAMFSGDTRTLNSNPCGGGGDFAICQNFPASAWGKKFLTAPTSQAGGAANKEKNLFRIALKDVDQKVWVNNTLIYPTGTPPSCVENFNISSTLIPSTTTPAYLSFQSICDNYIESDRPMMICQFLSGACIGDGDPDMAFISPLEQGINKVSFFRNTTQTITANVLTLIGSAKDTPTLVDGNAAPSKVWFIRPHTNYPGKNVYIKHWPTAAQRQVIVNGDSAFTAITYGLGNVESYMYNAGTNILSYFPAPPNPCNKDVPEDSCREYTCSKTQFQIRTAIAILKPDSIKVLLSKIPGILPNKDIVMKNPYSPAPTYTVRANGDTTWYFTLPGYYTIDTPGTYTVTFQLWHPDVEGCDKKLEWQQKIRVFASPQIGFTYIPNPICPNTNVNFTAGTMDSSSFVPVHDWSWSSSPYGIKADTLKTNTLTFFYGNAGVDTVKLYVRTADYCVGDSTQFLTINPNPVVNVVKDSIHTCAGGNVTFNVQSPLTGAVYTLYDAPTGGSVVQVDTVFTFNNVTADATYYIGCVSATGCTSVDRKAIKIKVTQLPTAIATPTTITACIGTSATFNVTNSQPNVNYNWFDAATGGTQLASGISYSISNVTTSATYYLEASENGCTSVTRFAVNLIAATPPNLTLVKDTLSVCAGDAATFSVLNPDGTVTYNWYTVATGGTATTGANYSINPANASASYWISATSVNGCTTPRLKVDLTVKTRPVVTVVFPDSVTLCKGLRQTFCVLNPLTGAKYKWYNQSSGGVLVQPDSSCFTTPPLVQGDTTYYVDGEKDGCVSFTRATVKIKALQELDTTSVTGTKVETNFIRFDWTAVPNATGYKITVTVNGGTPTTTTYAAGILNHTILNLVPGDTAWATVVALGINPCQNSTSRKVYGITIKNETYYPNVFTPNGDGKNDKIVICGSSFKDIKYAVYNQWGEKIWEVNGLVATDAKGCYLLWDGTQRGVLQPVGVYMFTSKITFLDGKVEEKKGTINLIR